jgi:ribosomal protein L34E
MADAATWAASGMAGLGLDAATMIEAWHVNRVRADATALEGDDLALAIRRLLEAQGPVWSGSATGLLDALAGHVSATVLKERGWPKTASALGLRLRRLAPALRRAWRIEVAQTKGGHDGTRTTTAKMPITRCAKCDLATTGVSRMPPPRMHWLTTYSEMLGKAEREFTKMTDTQEQEPHLDAAMNCALTTWHVSDRLWADQAHWRPNSPAPKSKRSCFNEWVCKKAPALGHCRNICDGVKHLELTYPNALEIKVKTSAATPCIQNSQIFIQDHRPVVLISNTPHVVKVILGGTQYELAAVLRQAIDSWPAIRALLY